MASEFEFYCLACTGTDNQRRRGIVKIKSESDVPIPPGFNHAEAIENGSPIERNVDDLHCKGLGKMMFASSRYLVPPAQPPQPPAFWDTFCQQVDAAWRAFENSDWNLALRGVNNRGTGNYQPVPIAIKNYIRTNNGTVKIRGNYYFLRESHTAELSLHRSIPSRANVPANVRSFIYHL